jgi:uncharacterized protein (DUF885 family)
MKKCPVPDVTLTPGDGVPGPRAVRDVADAYVVARAKLNPLLATRLGLGWGQDQLPDLSPAGQQAEDDLARSTLTELDAVVSAGPPSDADERRCARLLRERLEAGLLLSASGEHLRDLRNIFGPINQVRNVFLLMPATTADDWAMIARRMSGVPEALAGQRACLTEGARRGLLAAPLQAVTVIEQLAEWMTAGGGRGWFADFGAGADIPPPLRADLDAAAGAAITAVSDLRDWLISDYVAQAEGTPDAVGEERYQIGARQWTGADIDPREAYAWGWSEYQRLRAEMAKQARAVLPGATAAEAMRYLDAQGEAVEGVEEIRLRLQQLMDDTIARLDHSHFQLADPVKRVEACIAPAGSAAAPYYTPPTQDFSRPGRTWLPTLGETRFPLWNLISTWYHEGVPGHHLQLAHWTHLSSKLSVFQTSVGSVSACSEGWALYAERLMDELGFYTTDPGARMGYLDAQIMRAIRVVIDIGMHLELSIPPDSPLSPGETWTPGLGRAFFAAHSGRTAEFVGSEIVRYLGSPGQAISYKLGERAWLAGREAAAAARGTGFELSSWHMAALSLGVLGLDDLADELARL